jgi:hypothetical protein
MDFALPLGSATYYIVICNFKGIYWYIYNLSGLGQGEPRLTSCY